MKINNIKIQNFRKLKSCSINFSDKKTLFVGANNSGKTSAMHALMFFLGNEHKKFKITDFSIEHWNSLDRIGESWLKDNIEEHEGYSLEEWRNYCPSLYLTLSNITNNDLPKIKHLIPDLSWDIKSDLKVYLIYQPKDISQLKEDFFRYINNVRNLNTNGSKHPLPNSMREFLEEKLSYYFSIQYYLVDSSNDDNLYPLDKFPFDGVFKLSLIPAQRKFADSTDIDSKSNNLSDELSRFYERHLNPKESPSQEDIDALIDIHKLQSTLTSQLNNSFKEYLGSLKKLGYPSANYDPEIQLESFINSAEILKQNTKVKFGNLESLSLPEELNGLGYRNLIYIFFKLLALKSEWIKIGKQQSKDENPIEPIHLVLIEEPEAHLHSQVQQIFVRKAYDVLISGLDDKLNLTTQLVISTHSSYIIHEVGLENLHYFRRNSESKNFYSEAIDLSNVFDEDSRKNKKFVSRYLRTVHCDLFFANAIILVEGSAERMLLPYFIQYNFPKLHSSYISILEVNGAHAHRFKPLIEALGVPSLVLTDLDPVDQSNKKVRPQRGQSQSSSCDNLNKWLSLENRDLDIVLSLQKKDKIINNTFISYQTEILINFNDEEKNVIPYTFEDSIVFSNLKLFQSKEKMGNSLGMIKKMHLATLEKEIDTLCEEVFKALDTQGGKAQMALDILYSFDPNIDSEKFKIPNYIEIGLKWLTEQLN